jgi:hypothetical protein
MRRWTYQEMIDRDSCSARHCEGVIVSALMQRFCTPSPVAMRQIWEATAMGRYWRAVTLVHGKYIG